MGVGFSTSLAEDGVSYPNLNIICVCVLHFSLPRCGSGHTSHSSGVLLGHRHISYWFLRG